MPARETIAGKTPPLEWIAAAIGLLLILSIAAVIGREAIREQAAEPPVITIEVGTIRPAGVGYVVPFEAVNVANGTAVGVEIEGTLKYGPSLMEQGGATIDYVPGHGRASGGLYFTHDPRRSELVLRATGYQDP